jgi:hypothetical protein
VATGGSAGLEVGEDAKEMRVEDIMLYNKYIDL